MRAAIRWAWKKKKWGLPLLVLPLLFLLQSLGWVGRLIGRATLSPDPAPPIRFDKERADAARESIKEKHKVDAEKIKADADALRDRINKKFGGEP